MGKTTLNRSYSSSTATKQYKPLTVSVCSGIPRCSSASQEPGLQNDSLALKGSQTSTPKTSRPGWQGLRRTLAMLNTQHTPKQTRGSSELNTSWPGCKARRKIEPPPNCVPTKKLCTTVVQSGLKASHSDLENQNQSHLITTVKSQHKSWDRLRNTISSLLTHSTSIGKDLEDIEEVEPTPNSQGTTTEGLFNQSTILRNEKITPKSKKPRCVKGGFMQAYQKMLENSAMERRQLSFRKPSHTVNILNITKSFGIKMALVKSDKDPESGPAIFNITLSPDLADKVIVGSRLQLYIDREPLQLENKQIVHLQPNGIVIL